MMDFEDRSATDAEHANFTQANAAADAPPAARPAASANGPAQVLTPNAQGVVVLPQGVGLDDLHVEGRNLVVVGADGTRYVIPEGAIIVPQLVVEGVAVPPLNLAALLVGNEPEPAAGAPRSSGGNFASDVGPLQDAYGLGDLLPYTELSRPEPQEREILPDLLDREPTALFVTPNQPAGATVATSTVSESGLPARGNEPAGSNAAANTEATTGTIVFEAADGLRSVTLNGVAVTAVGQAITGAHGTLTITGLTPGAYGYTYTLTDNSLGDATTDPFTLVVTDIDGDTAVATLTIAIQDDVPTARSDTDAVAGGSYIAESGNVITGAGTTSGAAGADTPGADGAAVSGIRLGNAGAFTVVPGAGATIQGQYGALTIGTNGSYTYVRAAGTPGGVSDVFTYQLSDGDGDASTANLTIAIGDALPAILSIPPAGGAGALVNESGLPDRSNEAPGSNAPAPSESTSGTITYTQGDAPATVAINGTSVTAVGQVITVPGVGTLTVTSIAPGAIGYTFTLGDNTAGDTSTVVLGVSVTDRDGDVASGNLTINIVDDRPTAVNDVAAQGSENAPVTVNVLANDVQGADSVANGAVALVAGSLSGTGQVVYNGNGTFTYTPGPAETGAVTFRYSITDGDGDTSTATVTLNLLPDSTPTIRVAGDNDVLEAGLPARPGEPAGSQAAGDGEIATGTIAVATGADTLAALVINGINVTNGGTVTTAKGVLTVARAGADFTYSYRLADNTLADPDNDSFTIKATDSDGSSATSNLVIAIVDDVPFARPDTDAVAAGSFAAELGNVITGVGTSSGSAGADTLGADGARVSFAGTLAGGVVVPGSNHAVPAGGSSVFAGQYGTLTLSADGSYSYTRSAGTPGGVEDKFFYVLTDGDGDNAPTTLTIAIGDSTPSVAVPAAGGATTTVYETALPAHAGGPQGTGEAAAPGVNDDPREAVSGTVTFHSADGIGNLTVAGTALDAALFPQVVSSDATGTLVITGGSYDAVTGDGQLSYTYTLTNNTLADPSSVSFPIVLTDDDGDAATSTLTIAIVDDVPVAVNDAATQLAEDANVTIDVFANDGRGADGALASSVALVAGSQVGAGVLTNNGDGTFTLDPVPGQTGTVSFQYTMTDRDGDVSTATATITLLADSTPVAAAAAGLVVDEDGLAGANVDAVPLQAAPAETDSTESASATGSVVVSFGNDVPANPLGAFALLDTAGLDGQLVALNGTPVTFALGTGADAGVLIGKAGASEVIRIFVTGAAAGPGAGQVTYSYATVLSQPVQHAGQGEGSDVLSGVSFQVTDADGDALAAPGTFSVTVVDDVPTAAADTDAVAAGSFAAELGNVITGVGTSSGSAGADTLGADGARVSFAGTLAGGVVVPGSNHAVPAGGSSVFAGQYGTLTLSADGSYSYTRSAGTPGGVEDKFFYVLTDGDGDNAPTTLTIAIGDSTPSVAVPAAGGATTTVYETALPAHAGGPQGTGEAAAPGVNDDPREAVSGTVTFHSADGIGNLTVAGTALDAALFPQVVSSDATGTLVITGGSYDAVTGDGQLSYTYTLTNNTLADPSSVSFPIVLTDDDGDAATSTLTISIVDDVPVAVNDAATQLAEDANVTIDVFANDGRGADGALASSVALVAGSQVGAGVLTNNGDGTFTLDPVPGQTGTVSFQYTMTDRDGDVSTATATITLLADSTPVAAAAAGLVVDEDGLAGANVDAVPLQAAPAETDSTESASATGSVVVSFGNDVPANPLGAFALLDTAGLDGQLVALNGTPVTFALGTGADAGVLIGKAGASEVIRIFVTGAAAGPGAGQVTYSYATVLSQPVQHAGQGEGSDVLSGVSFQVTDADGDALAAPGTFSVTVVDDVPTAAADTDAVAAGSFAAELGNVITGVGTSSGSAGADTLGADGARVSFAGTLAGGVVVPGSNHAVPAGGSSVFAGQYGTLTLSADGSYSYTRSAGTPGGVEDKFFYVLTDGDGDNAPTTLTIAIGDSTPSVAVPAAGGATTTVYETALPAHAGGPQGTGEAAAPGVNDDPREAVSGTVTFHSADGIGNLTVAGTALDAALFPQVVSSDATGTLVITGGSYDPVTGDGQLSYTYTLTNNTLADPSSVSFPIVLTDDDGDAATSTLTISIVDDVPVAADDVDAVTEGLGNVADGNVFTGTGGSDANASDGVADTIGADGAAAGGAVVGARTGTESAGGALTAVTAGGVTISGTYGNLVIKADGSYTYTLKTASIPTGVTSEVFTYQIKDGDGDLDLGQLTIALNQDTRAPDTAGSAATVYEDGLADGVQHGATSETATGTFSVTGNNESYTLTLNGTTISAVGNTVTTPLGVLSITSISAPAGATGVVTYGYSYTLTAALTHTGQGEINPILDTITMAVTDATGDSDATPASIVISIVDDVPVAADDVDAVTEGLGNVADGNVFTGTGGSDANASDGVADTIGADGAAAGGAVVGARTGTESAGGALTAVTAGGVTISGTYGNLVIKADGSYTYTLKTASIPTGVTSEVFTYQIKDGDGDLDLGQLTIALNQDTRAPDTAGSAATVYEDGLADGVQHGATSETATGTFSVTGNNESYTLTLNGTTISAVGNTVTTPLGVLSITSISAPAGATGVVTYGYSYTLTAALTHTGQGEINPILDTITMAVTDATGDSDATPASIVISIVDDVPVAADDVDAVTEGLGNVADGNVFTGTGGSDANASDGVADTIGADGAAAGGAVVGARTGTESAGGALTAVTAGGVTISGTYGNLVIKADGSYTYTLKTASIPTGVTSEVFTYQIKDGDGDLDLGQLTIALNQDTRAPDTAGSAATVYEDGLADGVQHGATSETATGTFSVTGNNESYTLTLNGTTISAVGNTVTTPLGVLSITSISAPAGATGVVTYGYSYTLTAALTHTGQGEINPILDTITMAVTDATGDSDATPASIVISIVDDVPVAADDVDAVTEGLGNVADGNVFTGTGGSDANASDGVADTIGADGAAAGGAVVGARTGTEGAGGALTAVTAGGVTISGTYGNLVIKADGSYTYTLKTASIPTGVTSEVFTYQIKDGDGDLDLGQLTIALNQDTRAPDTAGSAATVYEDGLADGVQHGATSETATGTFSVTGNNESYTLTLNGTTISAVGNTVTTPLGVLTITSISAPAGATGVVTYGYSYTLTAALTHTGQGEINPILDTITMAVTDATGDSDATPASIVISIVDDVPVAVLTQAGTVSQVGGVGATSGTFNLDTAPVANNLTDNLGADGGTVKFLSPATQHYPDLTSNGQPITYTVSGDGLTLTGATTAGTVFTVVLNPTAATPSYTVSMFAPVDVTTQIDFNDGGYNFTGGNSDWNGFVPVGEVLGGTTLNNDSPDLLLTPAVGGAPDSTVNTTATIGGIGGGASVGATETFRVDFVTDLRGDPASTGGGDYDTLSHRDHVYDGHYTVNGATALFKSSGGSTVKITASIDSDDASSATPGLQLENVVGDGVTQPITKLTISYFGVSSAFLTPLLDDPTLPGAADPQTVVVNGHTFTYRLLADGSVEVGGVAGDTGSSLNGTNIAVFTANGYNSVAYTYVSGDTFQIGDFGASVSVPQPLNFALPIAVVDGDGDVAASYLDISLRASSLVSGVQTSVTQDQSASPTGVSMTSTAAQPHLIGSEFNDTLTGNAAGNVLIGGKGADTMTGGGGSDLFVIDPSHIASAADDVITDYTPGDVIDLRAVFASMGALAPTNAVQAAAAIHLVGNVLQVDADGTGAGTAFVPVATLSNNPASVSVLYDYDQAAISVASTPPLALDLNGDGAVEFVALAAGVTFDYDGDGAAEATAWVGANDGLLAIDLNADGQVNGGAEIVFGTSGATDLQGLASQYDTNHDGVLDVNDAAFGKFGVWQDSNQDGVSGSGEFHSLSALGISSIGLASDGNSYLTASNDVLVQGNANFVRNGASYALADAAFATASTDRRVAEIATTAAMAAAIAAPIEQAAALPAADTADSVQIAVDTASAHSSLVGPAADVSVSPVESPASIESSASRPEPVTHFEHTQDEPVTVKSLSAIEDHGASGESAVDDGSSSSANGSGPVHVMADPGVSAMDALLALAAQPAGASQVASTQEYEIVKEALADHTNEGLVDTIVNHFVVGGTDADTVIAAGDFAPAILSDNIDGHVVAVGSGAESIDEAALALALTHA